jgi:hypothetical protein
VKRAPTTSGGLILVLGAAVMVLLVGPKHDETPAIVVIAAVLALLALAGFRRLAKSDEQSAEGSGRTHEHE